MKEDLPGHASEKYVYINTEKLVLFYKSYEVISSQ
jgi:hypothetical protein